MKSKTLLTLLLVASLAGNASFLLTTFFKRPVQHAAAFERLSLTLEQTSKFEGAKQAFQNERTQSHQKMSELRAVLVDELQKEAPDRQQLLKATMEMAQVQTNMRPKLIDHLLALHAVLTPKQRETLANIIRTTGGAGAACPGAGLYSDQEDRPR